MAASSASIAVANAIWEQIKSSRSVSDDYLSITWSARRGSSTRAASEGSPAPPAAVLFSWWWGNRRGRRSTSAFPSTTAPATLSSMTSSTGCKHQIAARLAEAVGALAEVEVSDEQLALMLAKL
ncbi:uncharacterized protein [Elaeis guineensis]|uniref:Uncharacterized protein LOC105056148 isoform X2 n=1 Tax=Elaeis guineensis var. tenera TaxID=51953 RepID=A0A8N4FAB1_ELAGV|nr:uncharacterized protein LOC105056148 isoform X2 [Elaeis guineensis]